MNVVWKYPLAFGSDGTIIELPQSAKIVHADMQALGGPQRIPHLWIERLQPDKFKGQPVKRRFRIFATGQEIPGEWRHIGTMLECGFVWHVYEGPQA